MSKTEGREGGEVGTEKEQSLFAGNEGLPCPDPEGMPPAHNPLADVHIRRDMCVFKLNTEPT